MRICPAYRHEPEPGQNGLAAVRHRVSAWNCM